MMFFFVMGLLATVACAIGSFVGVIALVGYFKDEHERLSNARDPIASLRGELRNHASNSARHVTPN